jgi:uncharacterized protein (TIGR03086 family)
MTEQTGDATTIQPGHDDLDKIVQNYRRSLAVMDAAVRGADPDRWDDQSPCEDWTAREVLGHAITFIRNAVTLAGDGAAPDFHAPVDFASVAGDDPLDSWIAACELVETELLTRPERLVAVRMTPLGAEMPIATLLTYQGMDPVVHGWDVATATGTTSEIPDDLAELYLGRFAPVADQIRAGGLLGPERHGGQTPGERLLDFCGRVR